MYGIAETVRILLNSLLCDRKQCVKNEWDSKIRLGCHKSLSSSLWACIKFYTLCQRISEAVSTICDVLQFADDTAILCHSKNETKL